MKSFCIGVLIGSLLSLFLPIVPPFFSVFLLLVVILVALRCHYHCFTGVAAFFLCWIWQFDDYQQAQQHLLNVEQSINGTITEKPKHFAEYSQFILRLETGPAAGYFVSLNWSVPPMSLHAGQRWQLNARLKPVAGVANPGGVNKEAAALLQKIVAQGSVISAEPAMLLGQQDDLRQRWLEDIAANVSSLPTGPLLLALTMGERQFSTSLWQGLQHSGLAHLMAISGLHIGLVFGWSLLLLRLLPWPLRWLVWRQPVALVGSLFLCLCYAWLAGFAIPTVRATVALLLLVTALLQHKSINYSSYWLLLSAVLLLFEPFFVLSKSFWLSLLAVAIIFFVLWRLGTFVGGWRSKLRQFVYFHLSLTVFMALLSLLLFDGSAVLSIVSNLLFIPWCSVVAIPLVLLTLVVELCGVPGSGLLWQLCDWVFRPLLWWLNWCAEHGQWLALPDISAVWLVSAGAVGLLSYLCGIRRFWFLLPLLLLPILHSTLRPAQWQLHLIDVGQGLAVLLQYGDRGLLYDAGPRYGAYSATASQVLPYLRQRGIKRLDYLLLSHDDSDHTGDWTLLQKAYPHVRLYADISHLAAATPCQQLPTTYFDAQLTVLSTDGFSSKNDRSCVLLIQLYGWHILLPGDIGQQVERQLLQRYPNLRANVLILPHHGSNSSSHFAFLHQLAPQIAFNSASLYNRHQHPATQVQQRLAALGISLINTAQSGAIRLDITEAGLDVTEYRAQRIPFWLQKPIGNAETLRTTR